MGSDNRDQWIILYTKLFCLIFGSIASEQLLVAGFDMHSTVILIGEFLAVAASGPIIVLSAYHIWSEFNRIKEDNDEDA